MRTATLIFALAAAIGLPPSETSAGRCVDLVDRLALRLALPVGVPPAAAAAAGQEAAGRAEATPDWVRIIRRLKGPGLGAREAQAPDAGSARADPAALRLDARRKSAIAGMLSEARAAAEEGHALACYAQLNATRNAVTTEPDAGPDKAPAGKRQD